MSRLRARRRTRHDPDLSEDETIGSSSLASGTEDEDDVGSVTSSVEEDDYSDVTDSEGESEAETKSGEGQKGGETKSAEGAMGKADTLKEEVAEAKPNGSVTSSAADDRSLVDSAAESPAAKADEGPSPGVATSSAKDDTEEVLDYSEKNDATAAKSETDKPESSTTSAREARNAKRTDWDEYRRKLKDDPAFTPSVGKFWLHDDRF
ncbi:hypothetical protein HK097_011427, partial [Rhizophlyctis rosea]